MVLKLMKILVLGYFGYVTNQLDGQTIKTRDVYALLKEKSQGDVEYFDTQSFKVSNFNILKMLWMIVKAHHIFYLPAHNNLKYIFPLVYLLAKTSNTKINYLVIGGWLSEFLSNKKLHRYMLKSINGIYVETDHLLESLSKYNFKNLHKLYNFRMVDIEKIKPSKNIDKNIKLVFMARVHPMKGVDVLFDIDKSIKKIGVNNVSIDIYGQILESYKDEFFKKIKASNINYRGAIEPCNIYDVLPSYDLMLFPTKYYTEGFPGTILDAYISGLPVISTRWLNAEEFVHEGKTGYIVDFNNDSLYIDTVLKLIRNPEEIYRLKKSVLLIRHKYSVDSAWEVLCESLSQK